MTRQLLILLFLGIFGINGTSQEEAWRKRTSLPDYFPKLEKRKKSLFFLQRNMNENTIVYDLNCLEDGTVNPKNPIDVYWMRYPGDKAPYRREITWIEKKFAYGYNSKQSKDGDGFEVELVSDDKRKIYLKRNTNGRYEPYMNINGKSCRLTNLYVYADLTNWWSDVIHVDIYGVDTLSGQEEYERFVN
ncbi:MAG: DUF4833 domain-containing protein [Saprospiraceae bacterium]|nr:DUF4833 domain-containing protein [Saprospiraceae bacterium]